MADDAIGWMKELNELDPDKPFFCYYVPGATHAPHHPTPEWIKKISDMHLFDKGWNGLREQIFFGDVGPDPFHHERLDLLAVNGIRNTDHRRLGEEAREDEGQDEQRTQRADHRLDHQALALRLRSAR